MNKVNEIDPIPKIKQKCTSRISNIYIYIYIECTHRWTDPSS